MSTEGTKFETVAPDGDVVEVVVTKVHNQKYSINWGDIDFEVLIPLGMDVKQVNHKIFNHMANFIKDEFGGSMTTGTEELVRGSRSHKC